MSVPTPTTQRTLVIPNYRLARYGVVVKGGRCQPIGSRNASAKPCAACNNDADEPDYTAAQLSPPPPRT